MHHDSDDTYGGWGKRNNLFFFQSLQVCIFAKQNERQENERERERTVKKIKQKQKKWKEEETNQQWRWKTPVQISFISLLHLHFHLHPHPPLKQTLSRTVSFNLKIQVNLTSLIDWLINNPTTPTSLIDEELRSVHTQTHTYTHLHTDTHAGLNLPAFDLSPTFYVRGGVLIYDPIFTTLTPPPLYLSHVPFLLLLLHLLLLPLFQS